MLPVLAGATGLGGADAAELVISAPPAVGADLILQVTSWDPLSAILEDVLAELQALRSERK